MKPIQFLHAMTKTDELRTYLEENTAEVASILEVEETEITSALARIVEDANLAKAVQKQITAVRDGNRAGKHAARSMKPSAYHVVDVPGGWGVALCILNSPGYRPVDDYGPYAEEERAQGVVDRLNARLELTPARVRTIVRSTFLPPKVRRKHSASPHLRCPICSPLRCTKAKP